MCALGFFSLTLSDFALCQISHLANLLAWSAKAVAVLKVKAISMA